MKRSTRKLLKNAIFFGLAACIILYFTQETHEEDHAGYDWSKVRYQSTSKAIPDSRGICPGLELSQKPALVVARVGSEDATWLDALKEKYHICIYTTDATSDPYSNHLQVPANRGREGMAYLTFLIDNYEHIPQAGVVFVHGSRFAWHNDHAEWDNVPLLQDLNLSTALAEHGYHNLRCDWSTSTCVKDALPQGSLETKSRAMLERFNQRVQSDAALPKALATIFGDGLSNAHVLLGRADPVRSQCCAQFVASREVLHSHSRKEYVALRQWLLDGDGSRKNKAAPANDVIAGRILSYIWHILFIQQPRTMDGLVDLSKLNKAACPTAQDCYCRLYGRCGLEGCLTPGRCRGQYHVPQNYRVPEL